MPFGCKFCGGKFCSLHRLPENHGCLGLETFKEERGKTPEKWIYDPFKKEGRVKAGREIRKTLSERLYFFMQTLDSRKILYGILVVIVLLTLSRL
jgi:hypothetical protein